jgi:DUF4097 and DUF4098 domain-containing protein YvlB
MLALSARRPVLALALSLAGLILPGCVFGPVHLEEETRDMRIEHVTGKPVNVATDNGRVEVRADSTASDVHVVALLKAQTTDRLERSKVVATREADGSLNLGVQWADGRPLNSEGCSFNVVVPDALGTDIRTGNGTVRLEGLGGNATIRTSNGRIEATDQGGSVRADTSNGHIIITRPAGAVHARSSNGTIEVLNAPSSVDADSSNGRIAISLTDDSAGPVRADTSNGRIEFTVGRGFLGRLTLRTSNARISADPQLGSRTQMRTVQVINGSGTMQFGEGGSDSTFSTSNGSIDVRAR